MGELNFRTMLFLSAQPDEIYFLWQIELQVFNFFTLGIKPEQIHVLIGYNPGKGLSQEFNDLMRHNRFATFFAYPDERKRSRYPPSIRPHILKQHYRQFPHLRHERILYHDADIIFRELPDFSAMSGKGSLFVSDTRSYLDTGYIKRSGSMHLLNRMCKCIGVSRDLVEKTDSNAGAAQYFFNVTPSIDDAFWDKIEGDSESLFDLLEQYNIRAEELHTGKKEEGRGIQAWCADMWAALWNAVLYSIPVYIHKELDFCWPSEDIARWNTTKILHIAGVMRKDKEKLFCKTEFFFHTPYYEPLEGFDTEKCGIRYIDLIRNYRNTILYPQRIDLSDMTFLIPVRLDSKDRLENLHIIIRYLDKHFNTNIIVLEADKKPRFPNNTSFRNLRYEFIHDENPLFYHTKYNNLLIGFSDTPLIALYDCDVIVPVQQLLKAADAIRNGGALAVSPYEGHFISVDKLFKLMMGKLLDDRLLEYNAHKFSIAAKRSYGGAVVLDKKSFIEAGSDNEYLTSWGPEDIERIRRMDILGYPIKRVSGFLYHLPHPRHANSTYPSQMIQEKLMGEYLKVCALKKDGVKRYVRSWPWKCPVTQ
jgi:predicted glycosyltransferase involved in capsule biosynthesis